MTKKSVFTVIVIAVLSLALLFGLNAVTAPLIAANGAASAFEPFFALFPDAENFELMYDGSAEEGSIKAIYQETSGLGFVVNLSTTQGYTGDPIEFTMAVGNDGKIVGVNITAYPETKEMTPEFLSSFNGQDSALPDVALVSGATYSSSAIKNAVSDGLNYLIDGGFIAAGVKTDDQILLELLPSLCTGMSNASGIAQYEETDSTGSYIAKGMKAGNGSAMAYVVTDGDASYLAVCNLSGACRVYDVNGADCTESVNAAILDEVKADASAKLDYKSDNDIKKLTLLAGEGAELTAVPTGTFGTVTGAYSVSVGGSELYGFAVCPYGYSNIPMSFYFIIDGNGAIVSMTASEFILESDYFSSYTLDEPSYKAGFEGLTAESFDGSAALISGATVSSDAARTATNDVFAAFAEITANGGENNG